MKTMKKMSIILSYIGICTFVICIEQNLVYATAIKSAGDKIVASFNNTVIRESEINKAVNLYMNVAKQRGMQVPDRERLFMMILEAKIRSEVLKTAAKQAGIDRDEAFRRRLDELRDQQMVESYLEKEISGKISSEASLRNAYKDLGKNLAGKKEYRVRHMMVREEGTAKDIIEKLNKGSDFASLADQYNSMAREKGGDLGYVILDSMPEPIRKAIEGLKPKQYTKEPVKSQVGHHVFLLEDVRDAKVPTFEEAKGRLVELVKQQEMEKLIRRLVTQAKVKVFVKGAEQNGEASTNPK